MMAYAALIEELRQFHGADGGRVCHRPERLAATETLNRAMDEFAAAHPGASVYELRGRSYELIAEQFRPVLFRHSPFYAEMGGNGGWNNSSPGRWLFRHNEHLFREADPAAWTRFCEQGGQRYFLCCGPYVDAEHNSPPLSRVLRQGFQGIYEEARAAWPKCQTTEEKEFVACAMAGLLAVKGILERYAAAARAALPVVVDADQRHCLTLIAEHAARSPWQPPATFYEGLNALWFVREIMGELDGLMTNSLGRPDAWLIALYRRDLEAGRITAASAYDLVCRFLLHGDCLYDKNATVTGYGDHENEIVYTLGGCDRDGNEVFNDLTRMFLRAHRELRLIYPKPHCRFSANSAPAYLKLLADDILGGRGVYSLLNDDCLVEALRQDGKTLEDAREYSCTGCWDLVVDSREDNAGGNYFSLARILEATIHDDAETRRRAGVAIRRIDDAADFAAVYNIMRENTLSTLCGMMAMEGQYGRLWGRVAPAPLNSACSLDCLEKRRDFTAGGQRYNPHAVSLCFFANFLDSLLAIQDLCFVRLVCTLPELLAAVRHNWQGAEALRRQVLAAPHWGDARPETAALARRLHEDLYARTRDLRNERGGQYQLGYWIYREFRLWGETMKALPDGRHDGDYLAQSLNPSHFRNDQNVTTVLQGLAQLDLTKCAGNSVVNLVLDKTGLTPEVLDGLLRTFARLKLQLLQLNCTSREELLDAQQHPELHQDLIVRICGFSAKFTALSRAWQNEVISRKEY
ncbi:MAG: pyruvate formate lyase family protein [Lentisphaeria bacterium]